MATKKKKKPPTLQQQARQQATSQLAPVYAELDRLQQEAAQRARLRGQAITASSEALARAHGQAAPEIEGVYGRASERQAIFGKGYSDTMRRLQEQEAGQANELLAQHGSPQQLGVSNQADVLYGLGGMLPASTLNLSGAAFASAARMLPETARGVGQQSYLQNLREGEEKQQEFEELRRETALKRPGLESEALQQMLENRRQDLALEIQAEYLGIAGRKAGADITGYDPLTGYPTVDAAAAAAAGTRKKATAQATARKNRDSALNAGRTQVLASVAEWVGDPGKPIKNPTPTVIVDGKGNPYLYVTAGGKGTNDPAKAAKEGAVPPVPLNEAINRAYVLIGGADIAAKYGIAPRKIRNRIRSWLVAAGYLKKTAKGRKVKGGRGL